MEIDKLVGLSIEEANKQIIPLGFHLLESNMPNDIPNVDKFKAFWKHADYVAELLMKDSNAIGVRTENGIITGIWGKFNPESGMIE